MSKTYNDIIKVYEDTLKVAKSKYKNIALLQFLSSRGSRNKFVQLYGLRGDDWELQEDMFVLTSKGISFNRFYFSEDDDTLQFLGQSGEYCYRISFPLKKMPCEGLVLYSAKNPKDFVSFDEWDVVAIVRVKQVSNL